VAIATPFALGRFAVTLAEFGGFAEATGRAMPDEMFTFENDKRESRRGRSFRNPGFSQTARHPAVGVSWDDAAAYCEWLSQTTGKTYRLPSEAEWEYACRAGSSTPFWWGASISTDEANYDGNYTYGVGKKGQYRKATVPVESFKPNPWGLYQMHGNVWEWCADPWHENYRGAPEDGSVWQGGDETCRVLRGGSWNYYPAVLRSARRFGYYSSFRIDIAGFRVARTLFIP
jgi:formylglycine-generating enzyme required for sulfatase activity